MKSKLLLHACCAPCSIYVLQQLSADYQVTIYFYDPNIHPRKEYNLRRDELKKYAEKLKLDFIEGLYDSAQWLEKTKGLENEPEKGKRCTVCFDVRLAESARYAKENNFDCWTTVLSISPHKSAEQINKVGERIAQVFSWPFISADWKKNNGFKIASQLSQQENFYRQDYCGCVYSRGSKTPPLSLRTSPPKLALGRELGPNGGRKRGGIMNIKLFDYKLPPELIAQKPTSPRDHSRLLVLDKLNGSIKHKHFFELPELLNSNDVLVLNNSQVFPARLIGKKVTGGKVEIFLLKKLNEHFWQTLLGGRGLKPKDKIFFAKDLVGQLAIQEKNNIWQIKFNYGGKKLASLIEEIGNTPLPPYIKVKDNKFFRQRYQTVYAKNKGSVAAPTAGLHFTDKLLKQIKNRGVEIFYLTLHVGLGTFAPVVQTDITKAKLHAEWVNIDTATVQRLNELKQQGKNIIAVGTTTARALEAMTKNNRLSAGAHWINIYIYPGYKFKFINELITNFHLPKSSLLFMVSALAGRAKTLLVYKTAVSKKYHFFSFGDAMFITKKR